MQRSHDGIFQGTAGEKEDEKKDRGGCTGMTMHRQKRTQGLSPASAVFSLRALRFELGPQALPRQLTQPRRPHGTRKFLLSAAPVPDLTRFTGFRRVRPEHRRHLPGGQPCRLPPSAQYHPCYSGLQVQGTANTPAARIIILHGFYRIVNGCGQNKLPGAAMEAIMDDK